MPISYKNKIYTTLGTPTVLSGNVVSATDSAGVPDKDYTVKGKTIVWNQMLDKSKYPATTTIDGVTFTNNGDGTITVNGTAGSTANVWHRLNANVEIPVGHKVLISGGVTGAYWSSYLFYDDSDATYGIDSPGGGKIYTVQRSPIKPILFVAKGYTVNNLIFEPQLFDLTQMFGAGNEPATPEEFRAMFPDYYYPYSVGELKTIVPTSIEASGINLLNLVGRKEISSDTVGYRYPTDAYPEIDTHIYYRGISANGYLSSGNIVEATVLSSSVIAKTGTNPESPGYGVGIPLTVVPSTTYYIKCTTSGVISIGYANSNKIITKFTGELSGPNIVITTPEDCRYALIVFRPNALDTLATFENICVSTVQTNEYQPYKKYRANIPSSKYFPDGMKSAGSAYDEINFLSQKAIKRIGVVDLGTLNWGYVSGDNGRFTASVDGIKIVPEDTKGNLVCSKYTTASIDDVYLHTADKTIAVHYELPQVWVYDSSYTDAAAFKAAMSGVMLYYELATPVETAVTPPLQALSTFKGFTSFSAPNSLTQNGPLSVTYYAEGGTNPEKGWLTSYKRKLYMGRNIEWNQLFNQNEFNNSKTVQGVTITNNGDGTYKLDGTAINNIYFIIISQHMSFNTAHKYFFSGGNNSSTSLFIYLNGSVPFMRANSDEGVIGVPIENSGTLMLFIAKGTNVSGVLVKPQLFDLTQMFGAGNEPATPEEFWSYFDHKLYPYNTGETQPLFKISRKSQWGAAPKHYTARWDKVNAAMVRLNDAASFPTDITNFVHRGSVNPSYSNPFDNIYPWSGIKLCNISIDLYSNLAAGESVTKCVTAWEGDANFSYNDANGVWRYRPEFWGKSWEDDTYRYFDVTDQNVYGSNYVHYPEAIVGRWHGRNETLTIGGAEKTCLVPSVGMPAKRIAMSTLHTYAKNYGATIDSIYSIDADTLLCVVEFATMNTQNAIGEGVSNLYRQSSDLIQEDVTNSATVKVLAEAGNACCIPGAIFDIGTSNGGNQVGSFTVVSATPNVVDAQYLDVTLDRAVTATTTNYWSVQGLVNVADEGVGSKSGYIGENGKCNAYYRGIVMFGNRWTYILGAYQGANDRHIWIANSDAEADNYDALDTTVHYDTGLVLAKSVGYTKNLGLPSRSGLLSIPAFCIETGGNNNSPVGDYFFNDVYSYNTILQLGGSAATTLNNGAFCCRWTTTASFDDRFVSARPRLKNP